MGRKTTDRCGRAENVPPGEEIRDSERLGLALAAAEMGVWEWDIRTNTMCWSRECDKILGRPRYDGRLESFMRLVHPADAGRVRGLIARSMDSAEDIRAEFRIVRPDGEVRWLACVGRVCGGIGSSRRMLGTVQDVTRRHEFEESLRQSEERYRAVVEDQTEVISRFRSDGTVTFVNDVYCRVFGKTRAELLGSKWPMRVAPGDIPLIVGWHGGMTPSDPVVIIENRVLDASDRVRWMQFVNRGFFDEQGRLVETQSVGRDVTERREAQENARRCARRLVELDEKLRKTIAMELHDGIGQKLAALGITLQAVAGSLPRNSRERSGAVLDETERLLREIWSDLRGIMVGLRPPELDDFGLPTALGGMVEEFTRRSGIPVSFLCGKDFPQLSAQRETCLFRFAQEALSNVARHSGAKRATVRLDHGSGKVLLAIEDDGKGFEPGCRTPGPDSGWGMTILRERVEEIGGSMRVDSASGKGTRISAELSED